MSNVYGIAKVITPMCVCGLLKNFVLKITFILYFNGIKLCSLITTKQGLDNRLLIA